MKLYTKHVFAILLIATLLFANSHFNNKEDRKGERKENLAEKLKEKEYSQEKSAAERAHQKVRERHQLSGQCRGLTAQNRSNCEEKVNRIFRDDVQQGFKERLKERRNMTKTAVEERQNESEKSRTGIHTKHKRIHEQRINATKEEKQKGLLNRLENSIENAEKHTVLMKRAIEKAKEKGHDARRLEFLLEKYQKSLNAAKVFYDDEHYRKAIAELHEAKHTFKEFRKVFANVVGKHKKGEKHKEDDES